MTGRSIIRLIPLSFFFILNIFISSAFAQTELYPGLSGQALLDQLRADYKPAHVLNYDDARDTMFAVIDNQANQVSGVYSGYTITLDPQADPSTDAYNKGINTEHTWPQSKGTDTGNARSDLNHIFPARNEVNSSRGNDPFAEINDSQTDKWWRDDYYLTTIPSSYIDEYSEKDNDGYFEPREEHKGNAARAMFYMYTMYSEQLDTVFFNLQKNTLRLWHNADPADQAEQDRADRIAPYQDGKLNPFILDSTLVRRGFFDDGTASTIDNPANFTATAAGESQIDLSWTKNSAGDDVMIVWNTSGTFSTPQDGISYQDGQQALGGKIIGRTSAGSYAHTGLNAGTTYYYRAYSVHGAAGAELYSAGTSAQATTTGGATAVPGDVLITEIMQNPSAVSDTDGEWFEVYNASAQVIDLNGWIIKDLDSDSHQINNGGPLLIQPGSYLVLGRNGNTTTNGGVTVDYTYSGINLANAADELILLLSDGSTEIDRVVYDGGPSWPDPNGASMYFNGAFSQDNNDNTLWAESDVPWAGSQGDLGSPGYANTASTFTGKPAGMVRSFALTVFPNPFNPETTIRYTLKKNGPVTLAVFDITGKKVVSLVEERQTAGSYTVRWAGSDGLGRRVGSGVYLIVLKSGQTRTARKVTFLQ